MKFLDITKTLPIKGRGWPFRSLKTVTDITVHHAGAPDHHGPSQFAAYHVLPKSKQGKGYPAIAYHFVILPDGTINQCLPLTAWSSHNGFNNKNAIGVCLAGNFENHPATDAQMESLGWVIRHIREVVPYVKYLCGHREYPKRIGRTLCPGKFFDMEALRQKYAMYRNPKCDLIHTIVKPA